MSEFGGGDSVDCVEIAFLKCLRQYKRIKSNRIRETNSIVSLIFNLKKELTSNPIVKRDFLQHYMVVSQLLDECSSKQKMLENHNKQLISTFECWLKFGQDTFQEIDDKTNQIMHLVEKFKGNLQKSTETNHQENDCIVSILSEKLNELHEKFIVQNKKAKLEYLIKKLIQEEDLF